MVALGDSYSSGTGLGSVTAAQCDRDAYAYAPRARRDILARTHSVTGFTFVACIGDKTADVWNDQLPLVRSSHNVASITIGGNDIGFSAKVKGCAIGRCGSDTYSLQADVRGGRQTWDDLYKKLYTTYVNVRRRMSRSGNLYVLTYPIPFSRATSSCAGLDATEQNAANALVTRLGDTIYQAVQQANKLLPAAHGRPGNVRFVDWRTGTRIANGYTIPSGYSGAGRKFATYSSPDGLCTKTPGRSPFVNGYVISATNYMNSFHPNSTGYWRGAELFAAAVRKHQP
jgi:lysophospholipase L1-like esterase